MGRLIKVKVRAGQSLPFPGVCVHCGQPGDQPLPLRRRIGRLTRLTSVPLCEQCAGEVRRRSAEEERLLKIGAASGALAFSLLLLLTFIFLPSALPIEARVLLALLVAGLVAVGLYTLFRRAAARSARPEKKAILNAVRLADFSWRATTFEFANEDVARRFADLNRSRLMELPTVGSPLTERPIT
jgi:hypothetical protein